MAELRLEPLAAMATSLMRATVRVVWRDLTDFDADGRAGTVAGTQTIELDWCLGTWKRDHFSSVFYHELSHIWLRHRVPGDQAEREADALAERFSERCGAGLPWRLACTRTNWEAETYMLPRFAEFAAELRAERGGVRSAASTLRTATRQTYTPTVLEAEYRTGALSRTRQTVRGTVESMIARSLGLPNGEGDGVEWAVAGGFVRAAR